MLASVSIGLDLDQAIFPSAREAFVIATLATEQSGVGFDYRQILSRKVLLSHNFKTNRNFCERRKIVSQQIMTLDFCEETSVQRGICLLDTREGTQYSPPLILSWSLILISVLYLEVSYPVTHCKSSVQSFGLSSNG